MRLTHVPTLALASALLLTACGSHPAGLAAGTEPGLTTSPTSGSTAVAIAEVHRGVEFYPACGNETLELDGTRWYQLLPTEQEDVDASKYLLDGPQGAVTPHPPALGAGGLGMPGTSRVRIPAVAVPGEGDDTGTLTVYADGMARFVSDSGDLRTWLTREQRSYNWVC